MKHKEGLWLRPQNKEGDPEAIALIILHGFGASCDDFIPLCKALSAHACGVPAGADLRNKDLKALQDKAPRPVTYVLPQARKRFTPMSHICPVSAWFNLYGTERDCKKDLEGLERCSDFIFSLTEKLNREGITDDRIFIGGFSQGGIVALHCLCREPHRFAGAFAISSCFLTHSPHVPSASTTPVFISHGAKDEVIPLEYAQATHSLLKENGFDVVMHTQAELGHSMDAETAHLLGLWIDQVLQGR